MSRATALQALDLAIAQETEGNHFYSDSAGKTKDAKGRRMFQWLAGEEFKHLQWVEQQRLALIRGQAFQEVPGTGEKLITKTDFPDMVKPARTVKNTTGELEALSVGIDAEKDSIALYKWAGQQTDDAMGKKMFDRLVQEEMSHLDILEEEYEWLRQAGKFFTLHRFELR